MDNSAVVVTVDFNRPAHAHELRPGDMFAFPDAPNTLLTVLGTDTTTISAELTLASLTIAGCDRRLNIPGTTHVWPARMVRTVTLKCLLCDEADDIEVNLPMDGKPVTVVCANHDHGSTEPTTAA
ncbi:hypothetical protein [Streptomyces sp. NPDC001404]|uniref:hypothetical protein n=1 Tax=Streptomyces sp. NPDC001404 TaxID=3364571 RepID=UPI00368AB433